MEGRYFEERMRRLWDGNCRRFHYWMITEIAVLQAKEQLGLIAEGTTERVRNKVIMIPKVAEAIDRRDRVIGHDFNAFLEIMRIMIILSEDEFAKIISIEKEDEFNEKVSDALIEAEVNEDASAFHRGLTSYDGEEPAMALFFKESCEVIDDGLMVLESALRVRAIKHKHDLAIGRTHGQHAQPITFGIKLLNYLDAISRRRANLARAAKEYQVMKLSGAVGVYGTIGPDVEKVTGEILGLKPVIATQIISLDYRAEISCQMALASAVIEKISEDLWLLSQTEFGEVREPFSKKQKGSSAMPHKKNPINLEKLVGLSSIPRALSMATMEQVATKGERDIGHSSVERIAHQTSFATLDHQITVLTKMINEMTVNTKRMEENIDLSYGTIASQKLSMLLESKGMSAEEAYRTVQEACFIAVDRRWHLRGIIANSAHECALPVIALIDKGMLDIGEIEDIFDWKKWVEKIDYIYERAGLPAE